MRTRKPDHLGAFDYRGHYAYFLTFCTYGRRPIFRCAERVDLVRAQILRTCTEMRFATAAYCFMPDHLHLLVEGLEEGSDCLRFISAAKQYSGFYYQRMFGDRLWQRYGYERTLRSEESMLSVARYVIENPLRAGLVRDVRDYPYLGSERYSLDQMLDAVQLNRWSRGSG